MPTLVALSRMVFVIEWCFTPLLTVFQSCHGDGFCQEDFKRFQKFLSFVAISTRDFEGIKFFQSKSEEDHGRNISVKFHQSRISIFREEGV